MEREIRRIMRAMLELYAGDAPRIQHFTKVHAYAAWIGQEEDLDAATQKTVEIAAIVHDIGIHECERLYGHSEGKLQEQVGPPLAEKLLKEAGAAPSVTERVSFLVAHHHTYPADAADWQILLEADFLVNGLEGQLSDEALKHGGRTVFRTGSGKKLFRQMFGIEL